MLILKEITTRYLIMLQIYPPSINSKNRVTRHRDMYNQFLYAHAASHVLITPVSPESHSHSSPFRSHQHIFIFFLSFSFSFIHTNNDLRASLPVNEADKRRVKVYLRVTVKRKTNRPAKISRFAGRDISFADETYADEKCRRKKLWRQE